MDACRNTGIETVSIPAYVYIVMRVQIISYALPVAMQCRQICDTRLSIYCEPDFTAGV